MNAALGDCIRIPLKGSDMFFCPSYHNIFSYSFNLSHKPVAAAIRASNLSLPLLAPAVLNAWLLNSPISWPSYIRQETIAPPSEQIVHFEKKLDNYIDGMSKPSESS